MRDGKRGVWNTGPKPCGRRKKIEKKEEKKRRVPGSWWYIQNQTSTIRSVYRSNFTESTDLCTYQAVREGSQWKIGMHAGRNRMEPKNKKSGQGGTRGTYLPTHLPYSNRRRRKPTKSCNEDAVQVEQSEIRMRRGKGNKLNEPIQAKK